MWKPLRKYEGEFNAAALLEDNFLLEGPFNQNSRSTKYLS